MTGQNGTGDLSVVKLKGVGTVLKGVHSTFRKAEKKGLAGEELLEFLIRELKWLNTITKKDEDLLREVLPRKYSSFVKGEPEMDDDRSYVDIRILGRFTPTFHELEKQAMAAVLELDVEGPFLQVKDPEKLVEYGPVPHPALVINGKVVSSGRVVMKDEIKRMITDAIQKSGKSSGKKKA